MRTRSRLVRGAIAAVTGGLVAALAATGPAGATTHANPAPHTWHVQVAAQASNEAIQTMGFYPGHLWIDQGDRVTWVANAAEIHTVTLLSTVSPCPASALCTLPAQGFNPGDALQSTPQGGTSYDGSSYYNSGVLTSATGDTGPLPPFVHVVKRYTLRFASDLAPGHYTYFCLVHGAAMQGTITVRAAGTPYPRTQRQYDRADRRQIRSDIADGFRLWHAARREAAERSRPHAPTVLAGVMDDRVMVMRFIHQRTRIRVGDRVTFAATSMGEPHTVTFGSDETGCGSPPCNPELAWNLRTGAGGNEVADYPGRNGGFTGSPRQLNSGLMFGLPPSLTGVPSQLTVRFTHAGGFGFVCALHDYMGMVGSVRVVPSR